MSITLKVTYEPENEDNITKSLKDNKQALSKHKYLLVKLLEMFPDLEDEEDDIAVTYKDADGDEVTIERDEEIAQAIEDAVSNQKSILRLTIRPKS